MSVINNVLKDLENKPSAFTPLEITDVANASEKKNNHYGIWFIVLLLLITALWAAYYYDLIPSGSLDEKTVLVDQVDHALIKKELPVIKELQVMQVETDGKPVKAEALLTGLQLNETDEFLELMLQLPVGAQSFLKKSSQNRYIFLISNAGMKIITPAISDNIWLENITIDETEEGAEIQFDTMENTLVETHHREDGKNYFWNIRLKKSIQNLAVRKPEELLKAPLVASNPGQNTAIKTHQKLIVEEPQVAEVKLDIKAIESEVSDVARLKQAQLLMQQREWRAAQNILISLIDSSVDKKARIKLLTVYKLQNNTVLMHQLLDKNLKIYPDENNFIIEDASLLFSQGQFVTLVNRYKNKLDSLKVINLVAASLQNINQHDKAIVYYQRSLKINPQQPRKWISLAISQEQKLQFERALQSYQMARRSGALNKRLQSFVDKRLQKLSNNTH